MKLYTPAVLATLPLFASNTYSRELRPHERLRGPKEPVIQGIGSGSPSGYTDIKSSTNTTVQVHVAPPATLAPTASSNLTSSSFFTPVFANANASTFSINSSSLPLVNFTLQTSWAGRLPISGNRNESRELFFWYWPLSANTSSDTLTIWLNGGPGCSSLDGFLEENGPLTWQPGTSGPVINPNAWTTQSDMVYIEQPVGTGFTKGTPSIQNESQLADQFYGFLKQFYSVFPELLTKKLFIAGESYAGFYIPYIATRIIDASSNEKAKLPLDLQSIFINDGVYSSFVVGEDIPIANFSATWKSTLGLNDSIVSSLQSAADSCGYTNIINQITYPPKGKFSLPNQGKDFPAPGCDLFNTFYEEAYEANSCFNIYRITDKCPTLSNPIEDYFSRSDVQAALHVPNSGQWLLCSDENVFPNGDRSPYSETLFPHLLDTLPRGITLWHGLTDAILLNFGDRITIQNLTWGGAQGFQSAPSTALLVRGSQRGVWHTERNLTYIEVDNAGHMIPEDQPDVGLHIFTAVIGKGSIGDQGGSGTGNQSSGSGDQGAGSGSGDHKSASWRLDHRGFLPMLWFGWTMCGLLIAVGGTI